MINKFARSLTHLITHSQILNLADKYVQNEADTDIVIVIVIRHGAPSNEQ